jgi:hypothetical protein
LLVAAAGTMTDSLVFERFGTGDFMREDSARERVEELIAVYRDFDKTPSSRARAWAPSSALPDLRGQLPAPGHFHVPFQVWRPGVVAVVFCFYILIPALLTKASLHPQAFTPERRTALLVALPPLMPWIVQTSISSGFTTSNFMSAGMCLALFLEIDEHGVGRLLK